MAWIAGWLAATRPEDFRVRGPGEAADEDREAPPLVDTLRRWAAVIVVVVIINTVWQILRAWIPLILQKQYGYGETTTLWFNAAWFGVADVGCLAAGWLAWRLAGQGWSVKWSRVATVACCCLLWAWSWRAWPGRHARLRLPAHAQPALPARDAGGGAGAVRASR